MSKPTNLEAAGSPPPASGGGAPAPARRRIPWRRRLVFVVVLAAVFGGFQEACFRLVFPLPEVRGFNRLRYSHLLPTGERAQEVSRRGISNMRIRFESEPDGFSFDHDLNIYGFRGPNFPIRPTRGKSRVVFIGDSLVEGQGAGEAETIPARFAASLRGQAEVINLGVVAAGFPDYLNLTRDALRLLRPDAVFLFVYANDLPAPPLPADIDTPAPALERLKTDRPRAIEIIRRIRRGEDVPRFVHTGPFPFFEPVPSPANPLTSGPPPDGVDPSILDAIRRGKANPWLPLYAKWIDVFLRYDVTTNGSAAAYLERIAGRCRLRGVRLIVAYIPAHVATHPIYRAAYRRLGAPPFASEAPEEDPAYRVQQAHLRDVTGRLGVPFLDLTDEYIHAERTRGRMFWTYDGHCNADGYHLAARICTRYWREGALPRTRPAQAVRVARAQP